MRLARRGATSLATTEDEGADEEVRADGHVHLNPFLPILSLTLFLPLLGLTLFLPLLGLTLFLSSLAHRYVLMGTFT